MAKVLGKANLFAACDYSQKKNQKGEVASYSKRISGFCFKKSRFTSLKMKSMALRCDLKGQRLVYLEKKTANKSRFYQVPIKAQNQMLSGLIGRKQNWWEKELPPNMKEVASAQDLVDSLLNAGDKLVILDFFSPNCGGCRALFPKVNYEEHKSMCYTLNVHVLPFFRYYRGAQGRLCQFSCTNATIHKFKDALASHTADRCSLGPTKGLDEKELLALAANKDLSFNYKPKPVRPDPNPVPAVEDILVKKTSVNRKDSEEKTLVGARGRHFGKENIRKP